MLDLIDLVAIGTVLLSPFSFSALLKLIIVVILIPLITNIYMFIIYDHLLKKKLVDGYDLSVFEEKFYEKEGSITTTDHTVIE